MLKKIIKFLTQPKVNYQPLIEVRIFRQSLLSNLHEHQKAYPTLRIAPVLKSNAYGHGLLQVAQIFDKEDLAFFMVDSFYEALLLRREGVKTKILVLGFCTLEQIRQNLKDCSYGIVSLDMLKDISENLKVSKNFHLKIDTGMHRQGILVREIPEAIRLIKNNPNIVLEGLCTHFADAGSPDPGFTQGQIKLWNDAAAAFAVDFPGIKFFHAANSTGIKYSNQITANVARIGIGLYGVNSTPTLEMRSVVSSIKDISPGEKVGYGITFESAKPMRIDTVPAGYYEGVDRRLSNKGYFKLGEVLCPIVGRVSMNMTTVDVSSVPNVKLNQSVVVFSGNREDKNSIENTAKICDCLPYEIVVHIPQSLRRVIV